ncbi:MAG: hypothetical protein H6668_10630 [Ardenticatenaceae bacterium]|nr:hypothetical protein [Ardenticatenaceae bacterium]
MTLHSHSVVIPDSLYQQIRRQAEGAKISVDAFVQRTMARNLPPSVENDLPIDVQTELRAMSQLSDAVLWQIAESRMNPDKVALYDLMLERLHAEMLTSEGHALLAQLREEADLLQLRKAHAYALLKSRGHELPSLEALKNQSHS